MSDALRLGRNSIGVGDRFGQQAKAQLRACLRAAEAGVEVIPVWNKSFREHSLIGSQPAEVPGAVAAAVREVAWRHAWHVDADHIRLDTVAPFLPYADFYTLDVADAIGQPAPAPSVSAFADRHPELLEPLEPAGLAPGWRLTRPELERIAGRYLLATREVGALYRHLERAKGVGAFITEVSMDETREPQSPLELLVILAALADEQVPLQTIAPKFSGRFNKGVDYVGDVDQFEKEFNDDLAVIRYAIPRYGLPANLKLSVHSGSDKFSIYPPIARALRRHGAGLHLKTAGTTWLEELIGLAEAGGEGLALVKEIYAEATEQIDELCRPYQTVIDIDRAKLPSGEHVSKWTSEQFAAALRHEPGRQEFNPHLRQLLHVAYKLAALKKDRYLDAVRRHESIISRNVTGNLFERHLKPIFGPMAE